MNESTIKNAISSLSYSTILSVLNKPGDGIYLRYFMGELIFESCEYRESMSIVADANGNLHCTKEDFLIMAAPYHDEIL